MNNTNIKELQKNEAIERMEKLGLHPNVIKEFNEDGKLHFSVDLGFLYWAEDDMLERVRAFEERTGGLVYHIIRTATEFGLLYNYFYVSPEMNEWEYDRADLKQGYQLVYVENLTYPEFSEFGSIGYKKMSGGLMRVA